MLAVASTLALASCGLATESAQVSGPASTAAPTTETELEQATTSSEVPTTTRVVGPPTTFAVPITTSTTPPTTTITTTTTITVASSTPGIPPTLPPPLKRPEVEDVEDIKDLCGLRTTLASLGSITEVPRNRLAQLTNALSVALDRYVDLSPPALRNDVEVVRATVEDLIDDLSDDDYQLDSAVWANRIARISAGEAPYEEFDVALAGVTTWYAANCLPTGS